MNETQHPRVREAFNPCSEPALIFHARLLLILSGIIDLEGAPGGKGKTESDPDFERRRSRFRAESQDEGPRPLSVYGEHNPSSLVR